MRIPQPSSAAQPEEVQTLARPRVQAGVPGICRRKEEPMVADTPGRQWLAIISRPTLEGFSAACTPDVALNLSAAEEPVVGPAAVRHFFNITRTMYDGFAFVHEARDASRTYLEWEGEFQGSPVSGATILSYSDSGLIRGIQLYHRPYGQVLAFAAELARRLSQP
jgi:hypothetical protein